MPQMPAVEVVACSFAYGKPSSGQREALDDVSFRVPQGSTFGLLGPNGSGKTTLFRILSTLLGPYRGSVKVFGADLADSGTASRRDLGVVFQSQSLDGRLTVEENLVHHGHMFGLRGTALAERIGEVLGQLGLEERRKDRVDTLSGGLRRRVDVAKGVLHRPRLLLLDEPSTGVDAAARRGFWRYLHELRRSEGVTIMLTTHVLDEAAECDHLVILDRGRLIGQGTPDSLKADLGGTVVTVGSDQPAETVQVLRDEFGVQDAWVHGREIRFTDAEGQDWTAPLLRRFGPQIESVRVARPSLEDVFLRHAGRAFRPDGDDEETA